MSLKINDETYEVAAFDEQKLSDFKDIFNAALKNGEDEFSFDGLDYSTGYAKYVIEYLEPKFN